MKISPILFNKNNAVNNRSKITPKSNVTHDSISFSSRIMSYDEVKPYRMEAFQIRQKSHQYLEAAKSIQSKAQQQFKKAKEEKSLALELMKLAIKNPKSQMIYINENYMTFKFKIENDTLCLDIRLFDKYDTKLKDIFVQNFEVKSVLDYQETNSSFATLYQYGKDNVVISQNLAVDGVYKGSRDYQYNFIDGELALCLVNPTLSNPQRADESYYFKDDKLLHCDIGQTLLQPQLFTIAKERYVYGKDGNLSHYLFDFHRTSKNRISWQEGFHFSDGKFIGYSEKTLQPVVDDNLTCEKAVFKKGDNFLSSTSAKCSYDLSSTMQFFS